MLSTCGWQKMVCDLEDINNQGGTNPLSPITHLVEHFEVPLQGADAQTSEILPEFDSMIIYDNQFISLSTMSYKCVWWRLFNAPTESESSNVFLLAELLFSLPSSNGKLERLFSTFYVIKGTRRSSLNNNTVKDLIAVNFDCLPLHSFNADRSIELWWKAKTRRVNQQPRQPYKKHCSTRDRSCSSSSVLTDEEEPESEADKSTLLEDWDNWLNDDSPVLSDNN